MTGTKKNLATLVIACLCIFLLGEDVEHPSVLIEPPTEKPQKKIRPPAKQPEEAGPRYPSPLPGPRRLKLDIEDVGLQPLSTMKPEENQTEPTEHQRVKGRIDGYFHDLLARQRARRGNVDPGWTYLAQRMEHYWTPDFSQVHDSEITEISGPWLRRTVWNWLGGWYENAAATDGFGFRPLDEDPYQSIDTSMLDVQLAAFQDDGYGAKVTTIVEVKVNAAGQLKAKLFETSGHPGFDRAVMQGIRQAIKTPDPDDLPPGPARSLYAMSARYVILPPLPVVGFAFDFQLDYFEFLYPLKKMVFGQAKLLAVYRRNRP
ncbi:MAG: energy transducer TonB [Deltaproteobacteria bacterium]|nr:energy transducer TonB [Deltaproteobacteria bacterium]